MRRTIGVYLLATTLVACLAEDGALATAGDADAETDFNDSTTGSTTMTTGEASTLGTADESDGTALTSPPETTDPTDPTDDGPGAEAACQGIDCGPSGACVEFDDGTAACECSKPTIAAGLQCFTCTEVSGEYNIDVRAVDVTVSLLLSGSPAPQAGTEVGELWLRNPATDEMIALGTTHSSALTTRVVPTGYEIVYRRRSGSLLPANRDAVVGIVDAKNVAQISVDIDLDVQRLEGDFAFDGAPAPETATENGRVWLRRASTGDEVFLGETRAGSYAVNVLPGVYAIEFESIASGAVAPRNHRARVGIVEVPYGPSEVAITHHIDIATEVIDGNFLVDDAPAPATTNERARVSLRDPITGDEFLLGETHSGSYSLRVVPGQYEIVYEWLVGTAVMPSNSRAVIGTLDTFAATINDIQIDTVSISGGFTIDGALPPNDPADDGRISLRGSTPGDEVLLGSTTTGTFARIVVPGVYSVHYAQDTSSLLAPANSDAQLEPVDVAASPDFDVDVPTAFVSGLITLGDDVPPESDYDDGWVFLRNPLTGDTVLLANTRMGQFATTVVPGTYEVVYAVETPGGQVPINVDSVVLDTVDVQGGTVVDVDIPVNALAGSIATDGSAGEQASLYLTTVGATSRALLGNTADAAYAQPVLPGRYLVSYGADSTAGGLPMNTNAPLSCIDLVASN